MTAEPSAANLRAVAVARLKRAASLPRMKDGRRPPMRDDAVVSEGDKGAVNPEGDAEDRSHFNSENTTDVHQSSPHGTPKSKKENVAGTEDEPPTSGRETPSTPSRKRRGRSRSRSRSRSRGSKDFKEAKAELLRPSDSSPEELPPIPLLHPTLASPIPSHFTNMPFQPRGFFPSPSPHPFLHQAASPPPTLEALREGLIRSNSARQMAMHKLTGGRDSPTTPPPFKMLRSNTVTGVERSAARNRMLQRLEKRAPHKDGGESELTSGTDDAAPAKPPSTTPSNGTGSSPAMSNVIDDRDLPGSRSTSPRGTPTHQAGAPTLTSAERKHQETLAKLTGDDPFEFDSPTRRPQPSLFAPQHAVLVEDDDGDDHLDAPQPPGVTLSSSPSSDEPSRANARVYKVSELSSTSSMTSNPDAERVPLFLQEEGQKSPYAQDTFPVTITPIGTPLREKEPVEEDTTEDDVVYGHPEEMRDRKAYLARLEKGVESGLSWVGADDGNYISSSESGQCSPCCVGVNLIPTTNPDPVQETILEVKEEEEEDHIPEDSASQSISTTRLDFLAPDTARQTSGFPFPQSNEARVSQDYQSSLGPETPSTTGTFDPSSASEKPSEDELPAVTRVSTPSSSSLVIVDTPMQAKALPTPTERDNSEIYTDWEDGQTDAQTDREGLTDFEGSGRPERSPSRSRKKRESNSISRWEKLKSPFTGRRSRSNSFARARKDDAPTPHRESATSGKSDQSSPATGQMQSSSSLAASAVPRPHGGLSPVPAKYINPKLDPLPGIVRLEEERRTRIRKMSIGAASDAAPGTVPNTRVNSPEPGLTHQSSDSKLLARYQPGVEGSGLGAGENIHEDGRSTPAYIDLVPARSPTPNASSSNKNTLPQTKEAALKWIQRRKEGKASGDLANGAISDSNTIRPGGRRKIALSDLLASARGNDSGTEKDDRSSAGTPRPGSRRRTTLEQLRKLAGSPTESTFVYSFSSSSPRSERPSERMSSDRISSERPSLDESVDLSRRPNGHFSAASTSSSMSNTSEKLSPITPTFPTTPPLNLAHRPPSSPLTPLTPIKSAMAKPTVAKAPPLMHAFDALVSDPQKSPMEALQLGIAPRKFIMASAVRQVVSPNEVKNRFLLLFNDILVIAKFHDDEVLQPSLSRRLAVRSIIELRNADLQMSHRKSHQDFMSLPSIKDFVEDFAMNPEDAVSRCAQRTGLATEAHTVANLLFKTTGLDATALTTYFSRRSNKAVFRAYLDRFGFKGMRIDTALRLFLLVVRMPQDPVIVEYLLTTFASRWFDANKGVVTYHRDLTMRLVLAMSQLNQHLHQTTSDARHVNPSSARIMSRDFIHAFRLMDPHMLVGDDLLQKIYVSIRNDRLVQGLDTFERHHTLPTFIGPLPSSLIARVPSDSVTIRIPKPDPNFRIHLHGQDLFFDPPTLDFTRSNEASFVIIGSTLGRKEMVLCRSGFNAPTYAGLPLSCPLDVERPFVSNTFTIAFPGLPSVTDGRPAQKMRRYRFNVIDETQQQQFVTELQDQLASLRANGVSTAVNGNSGTQPDLQRATHAVAIQALRDALVLNGDYDREDETIGLRKPAPAQKNSEPLLGADLISACEQNSLIPAVLALLQATKHPNGGLQNGVEDSAVLP